MPKGFLVALSLFFVSSVPAVAECNVDQFKDFNFSSLSQYQTLVLLSTQSEEVLDKSFDSASGNFVVPGTGYSVGGDWSKAREFARSASSLLDIDLTQQEITTVVGTALSSGGVEAYTACLASQRVSITYPKDVILADEIILTLRFDVERGGTDGRGKLGTPTIVGGTLMTRLPQEMGDESGIPIKIRRTGNQGVQFVITVDGYVGEVVIPSRPSHQLVRDTVLTSYVQAISDSHDGHRADSTLTCFTPPELALFVPGTVKIVDLSLKGEGMNKSTNYVEVESEDASRLCLRAYADSNSRQTGAVVKARADVAIVRREAVTY